MITPHFIQAPCRCGRRHWLPIGEQGSVMWACGSTRAVYTLTLQPVAFARLMQQTPVDRWLADEGVCAVHRAGPPEHDRQRCEDCGWLVLGYRKFIELNPGARVQWWPTGALVGRTSTGDYYLASEPMTPHRERRCYQHARVM